MERSGVTDLGHAGSDVVPRGRLSSSPGERTVSGGHGGGETPVPIPNTAVKPASADGTWGVAPWESRTPPGFLQTMPPLRRGHRRLRRSGSTGRGRTDHVVDTVNAHGLPTRQPR